MNVLYGIIYFIQDCLLKAQRALAVLYEDRYPCTHWVQQRLSEILYQRCNGSQHEFNDKVLRPTITLLARLKEKVKLNYNFVWRLCWWRPWRTCMDCMGRSMLFSFEHLFIRDNEIWYIHAQSLVSIIVPISSTRSTKESSSYI